MEAASDLRLGWYERTQSNARADAIVALTIFETANAIEKEYKSYIDMKAVSEDLSLTVAVSAAAAKALSLLYPDKQELIQKKMTQQ